MQDATQHVLVEEYISQVELFKCDNIVTCLRLLDKFKVVRLILFCKFQKQSSWILWKVDQLYEGHKATQQIQVEHVSQVTWNRLSIIAWLEINYVKHN